VPRGPGPPRCFTEATPLVASSTVVGLVALHDGGATRRDDVDNDVPRALEDGTEVVAVGVGGTLTPVVGGVERQLLQSMPVLVLVVQPLVLQRLCSLRGVACFVLTFGGG